VYIYIRIYVLYTFFNLASFYDKKKKKISPHSMIHTFKMHKKRYIYARVSVIHQYGHTYIYICIYVCTYICTYIHTCIYIYICICTYVYIMYCGTISPPPAIHTSDLDEKSYIYIYMRVFVIYIYEYMYIYKYTYKHTNIYIMYILHFHNYICTYIRIYVHI